MDLSVFRFLGLLCLVHLYQATDHRHYGGNCSALTVYAGKRMLTDFPCVQYDTQACISGPASFPEGVRGTASVEDPQNFSAAVFRRVTDASGNLSLASGIKYRWDGPQGRSSRDGIKGYYLHVLPLNGSETRCSLLDLRGFDFSRTERITFEMTIFPFTETDNLTYAVHLRSLPLAADAVLNSNDAALDKSNLTHVLCVPGMCGYKPSNYSEWTPAISTRVQTFGSFNVKFRFPGRPSVALCEQYTLGLLKRDFAGRNFVHRMSVSVAADNTNGSSGGHVFRQVPGGEYRIVVAPRDTYPDNDDAFQCYEVGGALPRGQCTASCISASTRPFLVPETAAQKDDSSESRASVAEAEGAVVAVAVSLAVSLWAAAHA